MLDASKSSRSLLLVMVLMIGSQVFATTVVPQNLEQLESQAQTVFVGVCTSKTAQIANGIPVTVYTFTVTQAVKGPVQDGATVQVRQFGPATLQAKSSTLKTAATPPYNEGQETILFLNPPSRIGLTAPVGLGQGVFNVTRDAKGNRVIALDPARRRMLASKMSTSKLASNARFTATEQTLLTDPPERVDVSAFCSLIRKMSEERERMAKGQ